MAVLGYFYQRKNAIAPWVFSSESTVIPSEYPSPQSITPESTIDTTSSEEITENTTEDLPLLDLNTATQADLETLPNIGSQKASDIIAHRERIGIFTSVEELRDVSGIGEMIYEKIAPLVTVLDESENQSPH